MNPEDTGPSSMESVALTYFTDLQAITVEAIAERIIPANGTDAGATVAGVVYYIDRSISGFSSNLQRVYRLGLRELERYCEQRYSARFHEIDNEKQDATIRDFLGPEILHPTGAAEAALQPKSVVEQSSEASASQFSNSTAVLDEELLRRLFAIIREHTIEGYFCDPIYGGNRGTVGWKLVGFPGAQWGYTAEQMKPGFNASSIVIKTLSDLRQELVDLPNNKQYYSNKVQ